MNEMEKVKLGKILCLIGSVIIAIGLLLYAFNILQLPPFRIIVIIGVIFEGVSLFFTLRNN